jgi:hypothetical protein
VDLTVRRSRSLGGLCASTTPRYQTATFRPVRPPVLPRYGPGDRMPVVRTCAAAVPIIDTDNSKYGCIFVI